MQMPTGMQQFAATARLLIAIERDFPGILAEYERTGEWDDATRLVASYIRGEAEKLRAA